MDTARTRTATSFHRELGLMMLDRCGMSRTREGLEETLKTIPSLRERFWSEVNVPGTAADINQSLEIAGRVADFFELAELMCRDALQREESCGGHFREEHQTPEGEAQRDDEKFSNAAVWEFSGPGSTPRKHEEPLAFEHVKPSQRSYK
jgi:succinate dehydrogenase / fumarate reductase flavoprotein subunit